MKATLTLIPLLMRSAVLPFLLLSLSGCMTMTPIQKAANKGDVNALRQLVDSGTDPNQGAPLAYAVARGSMEATVYLLDAGANPDSVSFGYTSLFQAMFHNKTDIARLLIERGADVRSTAEDMEAYGVKIGGNHTPAWTAKVNRLRRMGGISTTAAVKTAPPSRAPAPRAQPEPRRIVSDVDSPTYRSKTNPNDFALVIGIEEYSDLPKADFAERDAEAVVAHMEALGVPRRNIIHLSGSKATGNGLKKYLESWFPKNVKRSSRVFFYFSGHGAPDPKTGEAYLVPWDGDPNFLSDTAYPVKRLYRSLAKLKAKEVIVALDACFSGAGGRSVLAKGMRPLVTKVDLGEAPGGKITLLTAAAANEVTSTLEDKGHGMFTYFFLKGLNGAAKDSRGRITSRSLYKYLKPQVQDEARRQNREQTPSLHTSSNPVFRVL